VLRVRLPEHRDARAYVLGGLEIGIPRDAGVRGDGEPEDKEKEDR